MKKVVYPTNLKYCKSGTFRENFIFTNSVKRHTCDVKNSRLGHDLPIPVIKRVISQFREDFIFTKLHICEVKFHENKTLTKISEFTVASGYDHEIPQLQTTDKITELHGSFTEHQQPQRLQKHD